jgi:hypothetical protein
MVDHPTRQVMKLPTIATILLVLAAPAHARMRHDRICDLAQDRFDAINYNPNGGNAVRLGKCVKVEDLPIGASTGQSGHWHVLACGYEGYRKGKRLKDNPYKNDGLRHGWKQGWEIARKSCATDKLPFISDTE